MAATQSARSETESGSLTQERVFSLLSSRRRRLAIQQLDECGGSAEVGTLAELVAARENDVPREELDYQQRKRVYTSLHQTHLPKLADADLIEYDRAEAVVSFTDRAVELRPYLDVESAAVEWWRRYIGLSGLSVGLLFVASVDVPPFAAVPDIAYALVVTGLFVLLATAHFAVAESTSLGEAVGALGDRRSSDD